MEHICVKKLNLGGKDYLPGNVIPEGVILPERVDRLKACGYIAEKDSESPSDIPEASAPMTDSVTLPNYVDCISVTLARVKDGKPGYGCAVSGEQLQAIVDIMQENANDAVTAIAEVKDEIVLAFIAYVDSRKTVASAAQKRLSEPDESAATEDGGGG